MNSSKPILLSIFLGLSFTAISQEDNGHFSLPAYHAENLGKEPKRSLVDSFALNTKIASVEFTRTYYRKKGTKTFTSHTTGRFDRQGHVVEITRVGDTGRKQHIQESRFRVFDERGNLVSSQETFYGSMYSREYRYNDTDQLIKELHYNKKKIYTIADYTYNDLNQISSLTYKKGNGKATRGYIYLYYPDKKLRQVIYTGKKGRTIRVSDYSCDDAGKEVKSTKDTTQICTVKSYQPDGVVITTMQALGSKGTPWKSVTYTDSLKRLLKYEYYNGKRLERLYTEENMYSGNRILKRNTSFRSTSTFWNKTTEYDANGRITLETNNWYGRNNKKKKAYTSSYVYNSEGLVTSKTTHLNGRLKTTEVYAYGFYR